jgi:hypothetical protein
MSKIFTVLLTSFFITQVSAQTVQRLVYNQQKPLQSGFVSRQINEINNGAPDPVKTVLKNSGTNVTTPCAPQGSRRYIRACYLITPGEMLSSQFGTGNVSSVGWSWIALQRQFTSTSGSLRVYMQNSNNITYSKGTSFATALIGMTKMIDGTISIPASEGTFNIDINSGGPGTSTFSTAPGQGVYVAFEYETTGALAFPLGSPTVSCNDSLVSGMAFSTDQFIPSDALTMIDHRPETRFGDPNPDGVEILSIYTLGAIPTPFGFPDTLGIRLNVNGGQTTNEMRVTSQNVQTTEYIIDTTFLVNATVPLVTVVLPKISIPQSDIVIVKAIPGDVDYQLQYCHDITADRYNHADPCLPEDGGTGFSAMTGSFVAGFNNYSSQVFPIDAIDHCFINDSSGGFQQYQLIVHSADVNGRPGPLLYMSPPLFSPQGNTFSQHVTHNLLNTVYIPPSTKFFVGYKQLNPVNINACYQYEYPIRPKTFFYTLTDTGTLWTGFDEDSISFKLDIAPRSCKNLKLEALLQGFYDGNSMVEDYVIVEVRNFTFPYSLIDSDTSRVDTSGTGYFSFPFTNKYSDYYYVIRHRNHLETWSHAFPERIDSCLDTYDFTEALSKAFGSNMILVDGMATLYAGDVNQDDVIDAADVSLVDNDAFNFLTGYVNTDLTGDNFVDATDFSLADNNAANFVSVIRP